MKIAVLLTGMMRTYKQTYKSLLDSFPDADIFISTWDINGDLISKKSRDGISNSELDFDEVVKLYKPLDIVSESWSEWRNKHYQKYADQLPKYQRFDKNVNQYVFVNSLFAQWYKIYHGFKMIPHDYDLIIRLRSDILIKDPTIFNVLSCDDKSIIVRASVENQAMDYFVAGPHEIMNTYSELYLDLISIIEESKLLQIEKLLKYYLDKKEINIVNFPFDFDLIRPKNLERTKLFRGSKKYIV